MGEGTAQSDTAMGFVDDMAAAPQLSSLVSERRVHHAPNSPNSTVVQSNPNAQAHSNNARQFALSEASESKSSMGVILGGLVLVGVVVGFFLMQGGEPTEPVQQDNTPVAVEKPIEQKPVEPVAAKEPDKPKEATEEAAAAIVEKPKPKRRSKTENL